LNTTGIHPEKTPELVMKEVEDTIKNSVLGRGFSGVTRSFLRSMINATMRSRHDVGHDGTWRNLRLKPGSAGGCASRFAIWVARTTLSTKRDAQPWSAL
jgi:hypothetical protein